MSDPKTHSNLEFALVYAAIGWYVLPCHSMENGACSCGNTSCRSPGKHPRTPRGFKDATTQMSVIENWWTRWPTANIATVTGEKSGIIVIDVDPRNGGIETFQTVFNEPYPGSNPANVIALTGGGGRHLIYEHPGKFKKAKLGTGIDVKSDGGYVIVAPSNHASGLTYQWWGGCNPLDGAVPSAMPEFLKALIIPKERPLPPTTCAGKETLPPEELKNIRIALAHIYADEYSVWIKIGMILHSIGLYDEWVLWSQTSHKFDSEVLDKKWNSFKLGHKKQLGIKTLFYIARQFGYVPPITFSDISEKLPKVEGREKNTCPEHLLHPPGILGDIVEFYLRTSRQPQPLLAVQSSLAVLSVILGRKYRTNKSNYSSLFFVNIAKTASGKEHCKTIVDQILEAAGLSDLLCGSGYTSPGGIFSALMQNPAHIAIIDEFGKLLESSKKDGNSNRKDALVLLMECFGRCHGTLRPPTYSTMTRPLAPKKDDATTAPKNIIRNPAITLLGLTTPETFFSCLSSSSVADGFLGRFLVAQSFEPRRPSAEPDFAEVPQDILSWIQTARIASSFVCIPGNENTLETEQAIKVLSFTPGALDLIHGFDVELVNKMNNLDAQGLAPLLARTKEKSMRLSIVTALAMDPTTESIGSDAVRWAIDYARFCDMSLVEQARASVSDNRDDMLIKKLVGYVKNARDYSGDARFQKACNAGYMPRTKLLKLMRLKSREFADLVQTACERGDICAAKGEGGSIVYAACA